MKIFALLLLAAAASAQTRLGDYALILNDPPVAQRTRSRAELKSATAQAQLTSIRGSQAGLLAELKRRKIAVEGASQVLVNAIYVAATRESAAALQKLPGVARVVPVPRLRPDLNRALDLINASTAWSAVGGSFVAGAGVKIGVIDSGIDQNHPGFQDSTLKVPPGFPLGDAAYTNNKVIVARSYVALSAVGFLADPNNPAATSRPDDYSPRDRVGHGTAIAMIAAGAQHNSPLGQIQGVAPKAFLGNYKIFGSPGVTDFPLFAAFEKAMEDALSDGMDIVTLSLSEGDAPYYAPLDTDPSCGGQCDIYAQAVENAVANGMTVIASAGNDGNIGHRIPTLTTIHRPGTAPSAITVGATTNAHALFQAVRAGAQSFHALLGDGPQPQASLSGQLKDVAQTGNDGLACAALPANSLSGAIALVQRGGTCAFTDKIVNTQNAGAIAVVIYQTSGQENPFSSLGAQDTGIPAVMVGYSDGLTLKGMSGTNVTLDPAFAESSAASDVVWAASSRGPSPGTFGATPTNVIKPELVAPGVGIYTAAQKLDPNGDAYNATRYLGVTGTSYAVPMVAGAVALVKQMHPAFTPAQLKSAVVNTASSAVTDEGGAAARVNSVGAGKLDAGAAVNATATIDPATIHFGQITSTTVSISRTLRITNVGSASATYTFAVQQRDSDSNASVRVSPTSVTVAPGQQNSVTVSLQGNRPAAGSYEGFVTVSSGAQTLRVPYQYLVGTGVPADAFRIVPNFVIGTGDQGVEVDMRVIDQFGVPVVGTPLLFSVVQGGGRITAGDTQSFRLGNASAILTMGSTQGDQIINGQIAGLTVAFDEFARRYPVISPNGIVDDASFRSGQPVAPGSYIAIFGTDLADATQVESTTSLPVSLSTVSVSVDGGGLSLPCHLYFIRSDVVTCQVPWEFQGQSSAKVKVSVGYLPSAVYTLPLASSAPGFFLVGDLAAAREALTGNLITRDNPARRGQPISLYANGLGAVTNQPASGEPSPDGTVTQPLAETRVKASVTIGGVPAQVSFSGLAPGFVGLYQVNITMPDNTPTGVQQIVIATDGAPSQAALLPVQ